MEKAHDVYVRCSDFGWSDIGTWGSLYQHSPKDEKGNVESRFCMLYDTEGCIVKTDTDKLTVIEGLKDYIVVDHRDVLMICPKANEQNIKNSSTTRNSRSGTNSFKNDRNRPVFLRNGGRKTPNLNRKRLHGTLRLILQIPAHLDR